MNTKAPRTHHIRMRTGCWCPYCGGLFGPVVGTSFYLAPATSERSPILVGLTGVLAVPLKPSMRPGAFGVSMVETSGACSKVLVFSTDAVPSALTTCHIKSYSGWFVGI